MNIISTTQFPIVGVITFFAVIILLGCLCYFGWKIKGVIVYLGTMVTIIGLFLIYMGFTDSTL